MFTYDDVRPPRAAEYHANVYHATPPTATAFRVTVYAGAQMLVFQQKCQEVHQTKGQHTREHQATGCLEVQEIDYREQKKLQSRHT